MRGYSTEWNSTALSKQSDPKVYTCDTPGIWVLFTFEDAKNHTVIYGGCLILISCLVILN